MAPNVSCFLNLLRFISALVVVVAHFGTTGYSDWFLLSHRVGHFSVIVFFVLSGYVISYTTVARRRSGTDYVIARLSRIYSVLVPALLLTAVLLVVGRSLDPAYYHRFDRGHEAVRFGLSLLNLQESWWLSAAPPTNQPLWSLAYEFWFYTAFGVFLFVRPRFWRWALLVACGVVVGPKIFLLLPVWLVGVACHRVGDRYRCSPAMARAGLAVVVTILILHLWRGIDVPLLVGTPPFFFSNGFVTDLGAGALVALVILLVRDAMPPVSPQGALSRFARAGADASFSLYVLHHPLLVFLAATVDYDHHGWLPAVAGLGASLALAFAFSAATEKRRHLLTEQLERLFATLRPAR